MALLRRLLVLIIAASLAASPAFGVTPAQRLMLNTGPGWILKGSAADLYFTRNGGSCALKRKVAPCSSLLTTVRASTGYAQWVDGHLSLFAANTPRITDQGLLVEEARTNLAIWSQDFTNVNWSTSSFTTTANAGAAPDGTTTASRIVYVGGLGSPDTRFIQQAVAISGGTASKPFTVSFWLKSNTGSNQAVRLKNTQAAVLDSFSAITVTPAWKQYSLTVTNGASAGNGNQTIGIVAALADTAVDILVWDGQMENAAFATSPIPTTTVAVTRAADNIGVSTALDTLIRAALAARSETIGIGGAASGGAGNYLFGYSSNAFNTRFSSSTQVSASFSNSATATIGGSGTFSGLVKSAFTFSGSQVSAVANGGTKATAAGASAGSGAITIGSVGGIRCLNGYLGRLTFGLSGGMFDGLTQ